MSHPTKFTILGRKKILINTDPLRRCYDGHHYKSEEVWSDWQELGWVATEQEAIDSVASWYAINPRNGYKYVPPTGQN